MQPLPAVFVLGLLRQANGRPCADKLGFLYGSHIYQPAVAFTDDKRTGLDEA